MNDTALSLVKRFLKELPFLIRDPGYQIKNFRKGENADLNLALFEIRRHLNNPQTGIKDPFLRKELSEWFSSEHTPQEILKNLKTYYLNPNNKVIREILTQPEEITAEVETHEPKESRAAVQVERKKEVKESASTGDRALEGSTKKKPDEEQKKEEEVKETQTASSIKAPSWRTRVFFTLSSQWRNPQSRTRTWLHSITNNTGFLIAKNKGLKLGSRALLVGGGVFGMALLQTKNVGLSAAAGAGAALLTFQNVRKLIGQAAEGSLGFLQNLASNASTNEGSRGEAAVGQDGAAANLPQRANQRGRGSLFGSLSLATRGGIMVALGTILIILAIGLFFSGSNSGGSTSSVDQDNPSSPVHIKLDGSKKIGNGEDIIYTALVSITGDSPVKNIQIFDALPFGTKFKDAGSRTTGSLPCQATAEGLYNGTDKVTWQIPTLSKGSVTTLCLTLSTTAQDTAITNRFSSEYEPESSAGGSSGTVASNTAPSANNCQGRYSAQDLSNPLQNFGDPSCTMSKTKAAELINQLDPANAIEWYEKVMLCESQYSPNAYNPHAFDSAGAWGLVQMGRGKNGQFDHGDVEWTQQLRNGVEYNKLIMKGAPGVSKAYWASARDGCPQ